MTRIAGAERLRRLAVTNLPTRWGPFRTQVFARESSHTRISPQTALALCLGVITTGDIPLVRIHSQCLTGELFSSLRCDCGDQLELAMHAMAQEGRGIVIYEHQEGRGIGLVAKLQSYELQDCGLDTVEANHALGFEADKRDFRLPAAVLRELGVSRVRLMTNNPAKTRVLSEAGIEVVSQVACEVSPTAHSLAYLRTKKERLGHALSLSGVEQLRAALP